MLKSVVSTVLLSVLGSTGQQLTTAEANAWKAIEPRIGYAVTGGGVVALINDQGFFVAHRSAISGGAPFAFVRMGNNQMVQVKYVTGDETTQLVLLQAEGWKPDPSLFKNVSAYTSRLEKGLANGSSLIAVLPSGPIRAVLSENDKVGILPSKRGVTLNEIRFERPGTNFGGGLIFTMDGRLMGVLGATLDVPASPSANKSGFTTNSQSRTGANSGSGGGAAMMFGPGQMTVAYSISSDVLARVIDGFLSPNRKATLPVVGLFCSDFKGGGAEITSVTTGSSADVAGLKVGDVITRMGDSPIMNVADFMRCVLRQEVGATIAVMFKRGGEILTVDMKVGAGEML